MTEPTDKEIVAFAVENGMHVITGAALSALFREALAWGMAYGPVIPAHQWDEMRESMVKHYADRAVRVAQPAPAQAAPTAVAGPWSAGELDGNWLEIDHKDHAGVIRIVWKMEDDARSPVCEARATAVIDALNAYAAPTTQPAPQQEAQEPVAWMRDWGVYDPSNSGPEFSHTKKKKSEGWVPLYTAPQPQVGAMPLTKEQAAFLCKMGPVYAPDGQVVRTPEQYRRELEGAKLAGIRTAERAHGIKGGQHGADT